MIEENSEIDSEPYNILYKYIIMIKKYMSKYICTATLSTYG